MTGQKMKRIIFIAILAMAFLQGQAQKETNWWYFGSNAGLNFNNLQSVTSSSGVATPNLPTPVTGPINTSEGCFTLSDGNGNLLMSSDGMTVYNKNNIIMDNGSGLLGGSSATQSGIVVPYPGIASQYYIITVAQDLGANGIRYNLVDLSQNSGLGKVVSKNLSLKAGASYENIAAVPNKARDKYWIINRTAKVFYVWSITSSGISTAPTTTYTANNITVCASAPYAGVMKFSPDLTRFVAATYNCNSIISGEFDNDTGIISNVQELSMPYRTYGIEFSPSGEWIFIGSDTSTGYSIKWNDLRKGTNASISLGKNCVNFQLALDKRIYAIERGTRNLHVLMNPDNGGTDIRSFNNYLTSNAIYGLPTFATSFFSAEGKEKSFVCTGNDFRYTVEVSMSGPVSDQPTKLVWNFGDGSATVTQTIVTNQTTYKQIHNYAATGKYTITITPYKANGTALSAVTLPANVVDCVFKTNRMIRTDLQNTATKAVNR